MQMLTQCVCERESGKGQGGMGCTQIVDSEYIARKMAVDRKLETREEKFTFERLSETKSNLRAE